MALNKEQREAAEAIVSELGIVASWHSGPRQAKVQRLQHAVQQLAANDPVELDPTPGVKKS